MNRRSIRFQLTAWYAGILAITFAAVGIGLEWMRYDRYRQYPQLHGEFTHSVSILDVLFNVGRDAPHYVFSDESR